MPTRTDSPGSNPIYSSSLPSILTSTATPTDLIGDSLAEPSGDMEGALYDCGDTHYYKRIYYTLVTTTLFFVPVLIMLSAYSAIIWKLWVSKMPGEAHYANVRAKKKSKRKVIQMVLALLLVFVVCWLPLQFIVLYSIYGHSTADGVVSNSLSALGPLPYRWQRSIKEESLL